MGYKRHKKFRYAHHIPSEKPLSTIVYKHGYRADPSTYRDMFEQLTEMGHEVFVLARNKLKPAPSTPEEHAYETADFIGSMGLANYHSVGHSLGGYISIVVPEYIENKPESCIALTPAVQVDDNILKLMGKALKMTFYDVIETSSRVPLSFLETIKGSAPCCIDELAAAGCPSIFLDTPYDRYSMDPVFDAIEDIIEWPGLARRMLTNLFKSPFASWDTARAIKNLDYSQHETGQIPTYIYHAQNDELFKGKILDVFQGVPNMHLYQVKDRNHRWPIRKPRECASIIDFHITRPDEKAA